MQILSIAIQFTFYFRLQSTFYSLHQCLGSYHLNADSWHFYTVYTLLSSTIYILQSTQCLGSYHLKADSQHFYTVYILLSSTIYILQSTSVLRILPHGCRFLAFLYSIHSTTVYNLHSNLYSLPTTQICGQEFTIWMQIIISALRYSLFSIYMFLILKKYQMKICSLPVALTSLAYPSSDKI